MTFEEWVERPNDSMAAWIRQGHNEYRLAHLNFIFNAGKAAGRAEQKKQDAQIMEHVKHKYPDDQQELIMGFHNACTDGAEAIRNQEVGDETNT